MFRTEQLSDDIVIYCGDMHEILPTLGKFDACVTDPPYGIDESDKKNASRQGHGLANQRDYGSFDWDKKPINATTVKMLRDCSRYQIIFGGNYFEGLGPTKCWLCWDKQNGNNDFADAELAWTNLDKAVRLFRFQWMGMIRQGDDIREHPTQKPIQIMRWCIDQLPANCMTIVDPFMGSGTTGAAAIERKRKFTGIERNEKYFDIALRRLTKMLNQDTLF